MIKVRVLYYYLPVHKMKFRSNSRLISSLKKKMKIRSRPFLFKKDKRTRNQLCKYLYKKTSNWLCYSRVKGNIMKNGTLLSIFFLAALCCYSTASDKKFHNRLYQVKLKYSNFFEENLLTKHIPANFNHQTRCQHHLLPILHSNGPCFSSFRCWWRHCR